MSGLLPSSSEPDPPDGDPRVIGVDDEAAEELLSALGPETARSLFAAIHERPATPSELADAAGTSLQNAQYHLEKLLEADLIEVVDTRYSAKGREMKIYGPAGGPVVLFAGSEEQSSDVRSALTSLLGGVGILAVASLAVQVLLGGPRSILGGGTSGAATTTTTQSGGAVSAQEVTTTATRTAAARSQEIASAAHQAAGLPPGVLFFLGGALALLVVAAWWVARR